jgi:hypothetical protein
MSGPKTKTKYTSKGERKNVDAGVTKSVRNERTAIDKWTIKQKSWLKGQNPWVTVANENTADTKRPFVRVRAETLWGDPHKGFMFGGAPKE